MASGYFLITYPNTAKSDWQRSFCQQCNNIFRPDLFIGYFRRFVVGVNDKPWSFPHLRRNTLPMIFHDPFLNNIIHLPAVQSASPRLDFILIFIYTSIFILIFYLLTNFVARKFNGAYNAVKVRQIFKISNMIVTCKQKILKYIYIKRNYIYLINVRKRNSTYSQTSKNWLFVNVTITNLNRWTLPSNAILV